ncbi:hypothetical protein ACH4E7_41965 [Kitasatospora sp. NPDC018058]|uniref:hypothetical protein n=1 Tax=Kitasatospora sp. NPDC018058 TaxID=3364025 RepID=UPI0037C05D1F
MDETTVEVWGVLSKPLEYTVRARHRLRGATAYGLGGRCGMTSTPVSLSDDYRGFFGHAHPLPDPYPRAGIGHPPIAIVLGHPLEVCACRPGPRGAVTRGAVADPRFR